MATTTVAPMTAMEAHTLVLLNHSERWSRAVRNDGLAFVLFAGSTGQTYWTTERSCSCRGFNFRQTCAHQRAVAIQAERAREQAFRRKPQYEDLFPSELEDAF